MSPDSSSSEVDQRPLTTLNHAPIQMIQVPECTQSHGGALKLNPQHQLPSPTHQQQPPPQQQQQHHVIHVDYAKKLEAGITKMSAHQPATVFHQKPSVVQHKSDEELNLG